MSATNLVAHTPEVGQTYVVEYGTLFSPFIGEVLKVFECGVYFTNGTPTPAHSALIHDKTNNLYRVMPIDSMNCAIFYRGKKE